MEPKVSVIIPTKNRIEATLRCLKSVLNQSITPHEVIVVDDGSTDGTSAKIKEKFSQVDVLRNEFSQGGAVARNQGAEVATGDYVAFLDSDDQWLPNHLINKINLIRLKNSEGAFGTFYLQKGPVEKKISFHIDHELNGNIGNSILSEKRFDARTSTLVFRRKPFLKVKFDEKLKKHQDWDLVINFDQEFKLSLDKEPTVRIFVEQKEERMSQKLQHASSFYFIRKNASHLNGNNIFMFCVKQVMRTQLANDSKEIIDQYMSVAAQYYMNLTLRNKLLYKLLSLKIINLGAIYRVVTKMKY